MTRLEWKEAYATGVPALDYEHHVLIDNVNSSCDALGAAADPEAVRGCLASLYEHACAHFALEERVMREAGYALYAVHKAGHEKLIDTLRDMMDSFEDDTCGNCNRALDECLVSWFDSHFQIEDGQLQRMEHLPLQQARR